MSHNDTRTKQSNFQDALANWELSANSPTTTLKNDLKDEMINIKELVNKKLQEENEHLKARCSKERIEK